jgi:hypothetical protein
MSTSKYANAAAPRLRAVEAPATTAGQPPPPAAGTPPAPLPASRAGAPPPDVTPEHYSSVKQLLTLLRQQGRKPASEPTKASTRRRVLRQEGYASKTARVFESMVEDVNAALGLELSPMLMADVIARTDAGRELAGHVQADLVTRELAASAIAVIRDDAGGGVKGSLVGAVAEKTSISSSKLGGLVGLSSSHVRHSRRRAEAGDVGLLATKYAPGTKRVTIDVCEQVSSVTYRQARAHASTRTVACVG